MGKIKLSLVSGAVVEKPLVCAFKANNFEYVVLDNEMNGSMGLPIILVCKLDNNKLTKIADQNEWQIVKEYLKNIIAGSTVEFVSVAPALAADDIYYTQLTLPVPSFDALKKAYQIIDNAALSETVSVLDVNPVGMNPSSATPTSVTPEISTVPNPTPVAPTPVTPAPVMPQEPTPMVNPTPAPSPVTGPTPEQVMQNPTSPVIDIASAPTPSTPTEPAVSTIPNPAVAPASPVTPAPSVTPTAPIDTKELFKDQKEAFLQACENMFDALVQKFEKEMQNK